MRSGQPACIGVWNGTSDDGAWYDTDCALVIAPSASAVDRSGVVRIAFTAPPAEMVMDTAAAVGSSGSSTIATTSKSPNAR